MCNVAPFKNLLVGGQIRFSWSSYNGKSMREYLFVTASTTFRCKRCAKCCSLDVMLSDGEMDALGEAADRKWRTTMKKVKGSRLACCLLGGRSCTIYEARPKLCRVYPFMAAPVSEFVELGVPISVDAKRASAGGGEEYVVMYDELCPGVGDDGDGDGGEDMMAEVISLTRAHLQEMRLRR